MLLRYQDLACPNLMSKMMKCSEEEIDVYILVKRIVNKTHHCRDFKEEKIQYVVPGNQNNVKSAKRKPRHSL
jgi:hypothetical protein